MYKLGRFLFYFQSNHWNFTSVPVVWGLHGYKFISNPGITLPMRSHFIWTNASYLGVKHELQLLWLPKQPHMLEVEGEAKRMENEEIYSLHPYNRWGIFWISVNCSGYWNIEASAAGPKSLYPKKLSFRVDGCNKSFPHKKS